MTDFGYVVLLEQVCDIIGMHLTAGGIMAHIEMKIKKDFEGGTVPLTLYGPEGEYSYVGAIDLPELQRGDNLKLHYRVQINGGATDNYRAYTEGNGTE
jgi:hypothetical protein